MLKYKSQRKKRTVSYFCSLKICADKPFGCGVFQIFGFVVEACKIAVYSVSDFAVKPGSVKAIPSFVPNNSAFEVEGKHKCENSGNIFLFHFMFFFK